ncbi:MAG: polyprenyl diphosphate synthase, partial [Gemmatimonadota bacterium]
MALDLLEGIKLDGDIPRHIAVIMDGNGRWAKNRFMPRPMGHRAGMAAVRETVEGCIDSGVRFLTMFAFSQENWSRPPTEIGALMGLLEEFIERELVDLQANEVEVTVIGDLDRLGDRQRRAVDRLVSQTAGGRALNLNFCISYSGRDELVRAARRIAALATSGEVDLAGIDEELVASHLDTAAFPDPDLLIRTSGEFRVSNFLLWQLAYT